MGQILKTILLLRQAAERRIERIIAEVWGEGNDIKYRMGRESGEES